MTRHAAQNIYDRLERSERLIARLAGTLGKAIERVEVLEAARSSRFKVRGSKSRSVRRSTPLGSPTLNFEPETLNRPQRNLKPKTQNTRSAGNKYVR
jgi:hypothetical protein